VTEFDQATRKRCRNPLCRSALPSPVSNDREAFCCRGCYGAFYRHRCLVCETGIERTTSNRKICKRTKCRNALATGSGFGRFHANSAKGYQSPRNLERMQETAVPQHLFCASDAIERAGRLLRANRARIVGPQRVLDTELGASSGRKVVSPDGVVCYVIREGRPEQTLRVAA
jgi:hypothetical protein